MISTAHFLLAQSPAPTGPAGGLGSMLVPILCFGVIFYFGILRPQQKRQKDLQNLVSDLKTGDKVVTSGGIHGIVANIKDGSTLSLKVADNVRIEVDKTAIASVDREREKESASALPAKAV